MIRNAQKGFSLIELMVVVAIIGILATIAIPRVNKFIAKSRTSEAQVNLSSIYTFNKNFYVEFQGYTSGFESLGYIPEGNLRYNVGFAGTATCPAPFTAMGKNCNGNQTTTAGWCGVAGDDGGGNPDNCTWIPGPGAGTAPTIPGAAIAADETFTAAAVAQLVSGDDIDTWLIDQAKNLRQTVDGTNGILNQ